MDELTIFLVIIGIITIAIITVFTLLKNKQSNHNFNDFSHHGEGEDFLLSSNSSENSDLHISKSAGDEDELPSTFSTSSEEALSSENAFESVDKETTKAKKALYFSKEKLPEGMNDLVISMAIQRDNHHFSGQEIVMACAKNGMIFGEMDIFHYPANGESGYILFSLANMVEPGSFSPETIESMTSPGLSLFIQLPLPMNCVEAYQQFVEKSQQIAESLHADLYDDKFNLLTPQIISHTIETINTYRHDMLKAQKLKS